MKTDTFPQLKKFSLKTICYIYIGKKVDFDKKPIYENSLNHCLKNTFCC